MDVFETLFEVNETVVCHWTVHAGQQNISEGHMGKNVCVYMGIMHVQNIK